MFFIRIGVRLTKYNMKIIDYQYPALMYFYPDLLAQPIDDME